MATTKNDTKQALNKRNILVLDGNADDEAMIRSAIEHEVKGFSVLSASTIAEAETLAQRFPISLFFMEADLPDGSGLDFLAGIKTVFTSAKCVVVSNDPDSDWWNAAEGMGADVCMRKPLTPAQIRVAIEVTLNLNLEDTEFIANLNNVSLPDLIQLKCLNRQSIILRVTRQDNEGLIYFLDGEIIHCKANDKTGGDAFNEIMQWRGGRFEEMEMTQMPERTITQSWESLCMRGLED